MCSKQMLNKTDHCLLQRKVNLASRVDRRCFFSVLGLASSTCSVDCLTDWWLLQLLYTSAWACRPRPHLPEERGPRRQTCARQGARGSWCWARRFPVRLSCWGWDQGRRGIPCRWPRLRSPRWREWLPPWWWSNS